MPVFSDYLLKTSPAIIQANVWVRLRNNLTNADYISDGVTDANGKFTFSGAIPPGGLYTVYTGSAGTVIGTPNATGDTSYPVFNYGTSFEDGTVGAPSIAFASDAATGFYRPGPGKLALAIGGNPIEIWDSADTSAQLYFKLRFSSDANAMELSDTLGSNGRRLRIAPKNQVGSAASGQLEIIPGTAVDPTTVTPSQILLYNVTGTNYERMEFSFFGNQFFIGTSYNGVGVARNVYMSMGGSVGNAIAGQNAAVFYGDASVLLNGTTYVNQGKTWGTLRTTIGDLMNTGSSWLVIDTRNGTPASNAADVAGVRYRRGGAEKWLVGLNAGGDAADSFDWWFGAQSMKLSTAGRLSLASGLRPGTIAGAQQTGGSVYAGTGVPAGGAAGDFFLRTDGGGAGATHIYFNNAGTWIGIA